MRLLLVDNEDCFIHTLANYARQTGAEVMTYRAGFPLELIEQLAAVADSGLARAGPSRRFRRAGAGALRGQARRSRCSACAWACRAWWKRSAASWACWIIRCTASRRWCGNRGVGVFEGLPEEFRVGRYHSLYAIREKLPGVPGSHRGDRRRRHHGRAPSRAADGSGAVPSRIDPDAGRQLRPEADGKCGASAGACAGSRGYAARTYWSLQHLPYAGVLWAIMKPRMDFQPSDVVFIAMVLWLAIELYQRRRRRPPQAGSA